ncbi:MAG TPA: hypothetical protein VFR37_17755, partial [Longimicrobium sp.]|nr:hypothetical protein [Longimicrobium sp.]
MTAAAPATSACGVDAGRLAARRWKLGHQLFHLELASMTTLIDRSAGELARRDEAAAARSLALLADLYEGATATMLYASDFPPVCYERVVRPSMSSPLVSPGFSGLLNREHAVMMSGLSA